MPGRHAGLLTGHSSLSAQPPNHAARRATQHAARPPDSPLQPLGVDLEGHPEEVRLGHPPPLLLQLEHACLDRKVLRGEVALRGAQVALLQGGWAEERANSAGVSASRLQPWGNHTAVLKAAAVQKAACLMQPHACWPMPCHLHAGSPAAPRALHLAAKRCPAECRACCRQETRGSTRGWEIDAGLCACAQRTIAVLQAGKSRQAGSAAGRQGTQWRQQR